MGGHGRRHRHKLERARKERWKADRIQPLIAEILAALGYDETAARTCTLTGDDVEVPIDVIDGGAAIKKPVRGWMYKSPFAAVTNGTRWTLYALGKDRLGLRPVFNALASFDTVNPVWLERMRRSEMASAKLAQIEARERATSAKALGDAVFAPLNVPFTAQLEPGRVLQAIAAGLGWIWVESRAYFPGICSAK